MCFERWLKGTENQIFWHNVCARYCSKLISLNEFWSFWTLTIRIIFYNKRKVTKRTARFMNFCLKVQMNENSTMVLLINLANSVILRFCINFCVLEKENFFFTLYTIFYESTSEKTNWTGSWFWDEGSKNKRKSHRTKQKLVLFFFFFN